MQFLRCLRVVQGRRFVRPFFLSAHEAVRLGGYKGGARKKGINTSVTSPGWNKGGPNPKTSVKSPKP